MNAIAVERLKRNVINVSSVEEIDAHRVNELVTKDSFAAIRGLFTREHMQAVYRSITKGFDASRDNPSIGEHPKAVMSNFQKISIGGAGNHWDYRPRFMRVIYNPIWAPDIYGMRSTFVELARVRNALQDRPLDFAIDGVEDGLWSACRLQHYPCGGGNISRHRDAVISTVTGDAGVNIFHQMLLLVTSKGEHFDQGGAYVEFEGQTVDLEDEFCAGDVVVYDGTTMHGVHDIDPHKRPSLSSIEGRLVALVSLYKDMSRDSKSYAGYEDTFIDASLPPPTQK